MKLSPDPRTRALQMTAIHSKAAWMSSARSFAQSFHDWGTGFAEKSAQDAIRHARRCSRASWQIRRV